jgi:ABC-2 type transport system ATP-binding protein
MKAIVTKDLTKQFNGLTAVDNLNLEVERGEIFGLLGPNGAGKTTLMSMLSTILKPSSGTAEVNGYDIIKQPNEVRKSIGIVFQDPSLDDRLTGRENLEMHAMLYGIPRDVRNKRIDEVLELVELKDRSKDIVRTYSGGMRRRLEIARGLIHYPKVLFLDEPTLGLDPQTREHIWNYITELAKFEKITIVLTTHYMEEAEMLCNRVAIIDYGKIISLGTPAQLKKSVGGDSIILAVSDLQKAKQAFPGAKEFNGKLAIAVKNAEMEINRVFDTAAKSGVRVLEANIRKSTLNDVFLRLTGREIREERADGKEQLRDHARGHGFIR